MPSATFEESLDSKIMINTWSHSKYAICSMQCAELRRVFGTFEESNLQKLWTNKLPQNTESPRAPQICVRDEREMQYLVTLQSPTLTK